MSLNPAVKTASLSNPTTRANELNEPQFTENQGYFPYDLTHQEFLTPLFGKITPTMHLDTAPADRTVVRDNTKLILNRINGNFLSTMNQYVDSFYVPLRSVYPTNYEKLIPNPTKGDDLPNSALPQIPFASFIMDYLKSQDTFEIGGADDYETTSLADIYNAIMDDDFTGISDSMIGYYIGRLALLAKVLSRGELLDYLGIQFDIASYSTAYNSVLQQRIDDFYSMLYERRADYLVDYKIQTCVPRLNEDIVDIGIANHSSETKSLWRDSIDDIFERGEIPYMPIDLTEESVYNTVLNLFYTLVDNIFYDYELSENDKLRFIQDVDSDSNPWSNGGFINIGKLLAYQQVVAHYFSNDTVDNIFSSDLFMQNLRAVMYPTNDSNFTEEPIFRYNGVATEYDYISCGGFFYSLISDKIAGKINRQTVWMTLMCLLRRSLRYGDYFSTARPNMLAVGQLSIPTEGGQVSPIDVTKNLLMQRYLNASNYVGQGFLQYMASIHGVTPSDTGTFPRFISHRKIELQNQVTNNTADEQGKQTTNLVGYADNSAFDVFIDDFGYIISVTTFDVLPVYTTGIDNSYHFSDRFDYFNPMLQNIGDQPIRVSELIGNPSLYNSVFGYNMRNSEYKYKLSKAHGAFCNNDLAGFMFKYPAKYFEKNLINSSKPNISPDFIRDRAMYLDSVIPELTGVSPAQYFHFIVSCTNQVHSARKIQSTPPVLF